MKKTLSLFVAAIGAFLYGAAEKLNDALFSLQVKTGAVACMAGMPSAADFEAARVTLPGQSEGVRQRLYDYQVYPTAGANQINFFQNPVGQGITSSLGAVVGSPKTYGDTNMNLGGQLSSGAAFLIQSIEVQFTAGSSAAANTYIPALAAQFAAVAAAALALAINDVNTFYQSGFLELNILQKNYIRETPLWTFPPKNTLSFNAALASNSATTSEVSAVFARADGATYEIPGGVLLQPTMNFVVALNWPGLVATPSGFNGRVGVILDGWVMRAAQ